MTARYAIVFDDGSIEHGAGEPGDIYTVEQRNGALRFESEEAFEQHPLIAALKIDKWADEKRKQLDRESSAGAYLAKELEARLWLRTEAEPDPMPADWRPLIDEATSPYLYDECDVCDCDPWTVARSIVAAAERPTEGDMGTRARERKRIEQREWLKAVRKDLEKKNK